MYKSTFWNFIGFVSLRNILETFEAQLGKKIRNIEAEAKKCVSYIKKTCKSFIARCFRYCVKR